MLQKLMAVTLVSSFALLTGCATSDDTGSSSAGESAGLSSQTSDDTEARIRALEEELNSRQSRIASLEGQLASGSATTSTVSMGGGELFPPNARPGECYARVLLPEQYSTSEERVLAKEASARIEVTPAQYETATERVLVKEASTKLEIVPATYDTVTEQVLVRPASQKIVEVPATYRTVSEQVLDKPAYTVWKKGPAAQFGNAAVSQSLNATGELMCLVEVPATYKTVSRTVVDTPAATNTVEIPAEYKTIERRVVSTPAAAREVTIPAVYDDVTVTKLVSAAQEKQIEIPAEYKTITKSAKVSDAVLEWQTVLCETNANRDNVTALQSALKDKGYDVGEIDGTLGPGTIRAVNRFARSEGIPQGANYVPMDVLKKLGLEI